MIIILILSILYLLMAIFFIAFLAALIYGHYKAQAPFVKTRDGIVDQIINLLELKNDSVLYDLGCGDGKILKAAITKYPTITCKGYEIAPVPRIWAKIKLRKYRKNVTILNEDLFKVDVREATHIYLYLYEKILTELKPIFDQQLKPGTRVVSCDFVFVDKEPVQIIDVSKDTLPLGKKLYLYIW